MRAPVENVAATLVIYRGLPFEQEFLYQDADGYPVDLTGMKGSLTLRRAIDDVEELYTFSTFNGKMILANGSIRLIGMNDVETAEFPAEQAVGHLVVEEVVGNPLPLAFFLFNVRPVTTGVPL